MQIIFVRLNFKVSFIGEDGVDAGGVLREFFSIILRDLFNVQYGMFREISESNCTWFAYIFIIISKLGLILHPLNQDLNLSLLECF